jgi:hypothetical protein
MRLSAWISLPKDEDLPQANEDWFKASSNGRFAVLCDGASESFDSKIWAQCLGRSFLRFQTLDLKSVSFSRKLFGRLYRWKSLPWNFQAAFDRGSFAAVIGVCMRENGLQLHGVGDSNAFLIVNGNLVNSFPIREVQQFPRFPTLICSNHSGDPEFVSERWEVKSPQETILLLASDAVALWLFKTLREDPQSSVDIIAADSNGLRSIVEQARFKGQIRSDDLTLLVFKFDEAS